MNITIHPALDGIAAERLRHFAVKLADRGNDEGAVQEFVKNEAAWVSQTKVLNGQSCSYEASARLLADLRLLKWTVRADSCGIELESPPHPRLRAKSAEAVKESKESVRKELSPALRQQFADPLVQEFIRSMEEPSKGSRRHSILKLVADGAEVASRLQEAMALDGEEREDCLESAIQPYLQLVPGEEDGAVQDEFTKISLGDIWRYFRYTWAIPQTAIPGRQMFYLVRDAAHPCHAVMGIAALSNTSLVSPIRDNAIGWTLEKFSLQMTEAAKANDGILLASMCGYLDALISNALAEINPKELIQPKDIENPSEDVIARLQRRAAEFAGKREEALREVADAATAGVPLTLNETELRDYGVPPVSLEVLELEGKRAREDSHETRARRFLVAKKRAFEFARLLKARLVLREHRVSLANPTSTIQALKDEKLQVAINTALTSVKSDRVGTNILEITTCGAIAPYNTLLGGKLVALLLLSPEVADDYQLRYGHRAAIISSQLKNAERIKDCTLAWLNTTSLYSLGSSQYERLRLPAGIIAPDQLELRFKHIGDTEGYGTVQFSEGTVQAVQAALSEMQDFKGVNSIFGEGFSPKFRKLRNGMLALGFNPTVLMRHDQTRRMYAAPLWPNADAFMRGEACDVPAYVREPGRFRDATARIVGFWRRRWLASRLNHAPSMQALRSANAWALSEKLADITADARSLKSRPRKQVVSDSPSQASTSKKDNAKPVGKALEFWQDLAKAGPEACADELTTDQLNHLHVEQPLDAFLLKHLRRGFSIVLTGNAGDGKTHLLRRLEASLPEDADVVTDATAAMKPGDVSGILRRWKKAHREGRAFLLAANEYPLYLLRQKKDSFAPLEEVDRQCRQRLAYGERHATEEEAGEKVLVVDLSLRNPLAKGFAGPLLEKLLNRPEIQAAADADPDGDLAWNLRRLRHPEIRERLLELLTRMAAAGHRSTVRELWIWAARLLFGTGHEERKPVRSPERWFSSRLFEPDDRFSLSALLRRLGDPAEHSHPRWDYRLETWSSHVRTGWALGDPPSVVRMDEGNFLALKRLFYFEHAEGRNVLDLEGIPGIEILKTLSSAHAPEDAFKQFLIESMNRAHCAVIFQEMSTRLYLWIGHRYQEQPSHGHVANQSVSEHELNLLRPRLPGRLHGAFDYAADHLLLEYSRKNAEPICLRVDHALFVSLERLRQGLPRQLLPDRELNRLDSFLEQLRCAGVPTTREFVIHNHDDRTTAMVKLSPDFSSYESVRTP